jgi:RNase P/RNase MRP subunit p30
LKALFADYYIFPKDEEELKKIVKVAQSLNYSLIGIDEKYSTKISSLASEQLKVLTSRRVEAFDEREAKNKLHAAGKKVSITIGVAKGASALRFFSKNKSVDIIEISPKLHRVMDKNQADLMKQGKTSIGINLGEIVRKLELIPFAEFLIKYALKYDIKIAFYSGAEKYSELWHPRSVFHLLKTFGITERVAKSIVLDMRIKNLA